MSSANQKCFVDTHFHVFPANRGIEAARYIPKYDANLKDWMVRAGSVGVTRGVLVQPSFLGTDNGFMLNELRAHPEMLRGVAVVDPQINAPELQSLHDSGVRGIRLNLSGRSHEIPQWTQADQLWETIAALGWHLEVHTDRGGLPRVLEQLPSQVPLVVDHMGRPQSCELKDPTVAALVLRARRAADQVLQQPAQQAAQQPMQHAPRSVTFIKLSGAYRLDGLQASGLARLWLGELGASSLLWGSDWPCTNHEELAVYADLFSSLEGWLGREPLGEILASNPHRLYFDSTLNPR